jgi:hypothetical protein
LFLVFSDTEAAGRFALELCDLVASTDWFSKGLPQDFNIRVSLHAGPVYSFHEPITDGPNYIGAHVNQAARVEPITPPGQVYATQAFAALAAAEGTRAFSCEYVGRIHLAKGFGIKIYSVAIGREGRVAMPFVQKDVFGRHVKTYQYFDSSINPEIPRRISETTGGRFYRVYDDVKAFRAALEEIDALEKTTVETTEQVKYDERYPPYLKAGLAVLLLAFLLQNTALRVYP